MKKINRFWQLFVVAITIISCSKGDEAISIDGYFIFGEAYGFCAGDCAHFYKIEGDKMFRDNIDRYGVETPTFSETPDSQSNYEIAEPLINSFPKYFLNHANQTFGCPDCTDQGGYHLFLQSGSEVQFWHIDTFSDNQPEEIRAYAAQLREILIQLRD